MVCNNDDDYKVDWKTAEVARNQKYDTLFKNILYPSSCDLKASMSKLSKTLIKSHLPLCIKGSVV